MPAATSGWCKRKRNNNNHRSNGFHPSLEESWKREAKNWMNLSLIPPKIHSFRSDPRFDAANFFMKEKAYARAGVDIDLGNAVKATLPRLLAATWRPEVLGKVGGFGGLFAFDNRK